MNIFGALPRSKTPYSAKLSPIASDSAAHAKVLTLIQSLVVATAILFPLVAFMQLCATAAPRRADAQQTYTGALRYSNDEQPGESGRRQPYELGGADHGLTADDREIGANAYRKMGRTILHPVFVVRAY